jgi:hypothetical protein
MTYGSGGPPTGCVYLFFIAMNLFTAIIHNIQKFRQDDDGLLAICPGFRVWIFLKQFITTIDKENTPPEWDIELTPVWILKSIEASFDIIQALHPVDTGLCDELIELVVSVHEGGAYAGNWPQNIESLFDEHIDWSFVNCPTSFLISPAA